MLSPTGRRQISANWTPISLTEVDSYASISPNLTEETHMALVLRPLTLGELLDRAFQLYRSRFAVFVGIAAVAYLPLFVVQAGNLWLPKIVSPSVHTAVAIGMVIGILLRLLAVAAATSATIIVVSAAYLEQPITMGEAYSRVSGTFIRIFFIMWGMGIGIGIGLILLIVPGIILFLMWGLTIPVAVLEDLGLGDSLSRSRQLTAGHRFRVLAIYGLYFALVFSAEAGLLAPIGIIVALKAHTAGAIAAAAPIINILTIILSYVIECLVTPILTIALSLMYYDERVRKEAFDIQLMMTALGGSSAASAAAPAL